MDMFNIFKAPTNAFAEMLYVNGQEVYINGKKRYAIITNPDIKEFNDKYISIDSQLIRGDYIYYDSTYWMVWNQVNVARAENFKGIMRQAEHDVVFNLYYASVTTDYLLKCPAIISRTSDYTLQSSDMMTMVDAEIHIFVKDTTSTRRIMDLVNKTDGQVIIGQRNYDLTGISCEKKGYLDITAKMGTKNSVSDYTNNIYWSTGGTKPSDWTDQFDLSFYDREGQGAVRPASPNNYVTGVTLSTTSTAYTSTQSGSVTATWTAEANKETYADFKGYKVRLLQGASELVMNVLGTNALTYTFNGLGIGAYTIEVTSLFGTNNTIVPVSKSANVANGDAPIPSVANDTTDVLVRAYNDSNSYGTLLWEAEKDRNAYTGYTLYGYRVEVYTSTVFGGDSMQEYWETTQTQQDIRTGWSGENGWYVLIYSIFTDNSTNAHVMMKPMKKTGDELTALPNTYSPPLW